MMIWQKRAQDKSCDLQYMQIILNLKYNFAYHLRYLPLWKIMGGSVTLYWHFKDKSLPSVCNVKKLIVESESANQVFCIRIVFFHRFLHIKFNVQSMKYFKLQNPIYVDLVFENTLLVKLVSEYLHYLSCRSCTSPSTKWDMCLAQQAKNATRFLKNTNLTDIFLLPKFLVLYLYIQSPSCVQLRTKSQNYQAIFCLSEIHVPNVNG